MTGVSGAKILSQIDSLDTMRWQMHGLHYAWLISISSVLAGSSLATPFSVMANIASINTQEL